MNDSIDWLRTLDKEIRDPSIHPYCDPTRRRLTDEELARILTLVAEHPIPVVMFNVNVGIGCALYEPPVEAPYPGFDPKDLRPDRLLWLSDSHLPLSEAKGRLPDRTGWNDGWRVFSTMSHTDKNRALCRSCGLPQPKSASHYEY